MYKVIILLSLVVLVIAQEASVGDVNQVNNVDVPRRRHPLLVHGGLFSLSKFLTLKIKVIAAIISIAVVAAIAAKIFAAYRLFGLGSCGVEAPFFSHGTPYFSHETPYFSNPPPGYEHEHDHGHDHEHESSSFHPTSLTGAGSSYSGGSMPTAPDSYSPPGYSRKKDVTGGRAAPSFDISELTFTILNVQKDACKRRFVCELEQRSKTNSLVELAFTFFSQTVFSRYRQPGVVAKSFEDCAIIHRECDNETFVSATEEESITSVTEFNDTVTTPDMMDAEITEELNNKIVDPIKKLVTDRRINKFTV